MGINTQIGQLPPKLETDFGFRFRQIIAVGDTSSISIPIQVSTNICPYNFVVFGSSEDEDYKNDKSTFYDRVTSNVDNIRFELHKGCELVTTLSDDSFGELLEPNYFGFNYYAYILDWSSVLSSFGGGSYNVHIVKTVNGEESEPIISDCYVLRPYSDQVADKTIRLSWVNKNRNFNTGFDFRQGNLFESYRVRGVLWQPDAPEFEDLEDYEDNSRKLNIIESKLIELWQAEFRFIPDQIYSHFKITMALEKAVDIIDYNIDGVKNSYINYELWVNDFGDATQHQQFNKIAPVLNLRDRVNNKLVR